MKLTLFNRRQWRLPLAWLTALVTALGIVITAPGSAQSTFRDVQGHWAQACIEQLAQRKIISGYPDGSFRPAAAVTRAEFAAMIRQAFPNAPAKREVVNFGDIPSNYWARAAIREAYQKGFMSGYPGQIFQPAQQIPKVQVLVALANGLNYSSVQPASSTLNAVFQDAQAIPSYAQTAIAAATEKQLVVNYPNVRVLNPNQLATRSDVAAVFCQALRNPTQASAIPPQYVAGAAGTPTRTPTTELRGVWLTNIDSDVLFERDRLSNALKELARLNFNTVYPTVWNWGYTLYPSSVAEKALGRSLDPTPGLQGRDMLAEVVAQGHQSGLGVIPWFEFGFMAPADSELARRHPDWLTNRRDGTQIVKEGSDDRVWLNPFNPQVQQFILDLIAEIVGNYEVDGIQFDDHFGLPAELGYDALTVQLYQQEHQGRRPPDNFQDAEWTRWRAAKITNFMQRVFQVVKARKPNALVALSPNPQDFSYQTALQDWQTWERQGLIEELIVQVYRNSFSSFLMELARPEIKAARDHIPVAIGILAGLKNRSVPLSQIQEQVQVVRSRNFAGVSFFYYETLWNTTAETSDSRKAGLQVLFPQTAARPKVGQRGA